MVKFNDSASLDTSQVQDNRGAGGGRGGGLGGGLGGIPIGAAGGGFGLIVVLVLAAIQLFGGRFGGADNSGGTGNGTAASNSGSSVLQQVAAGGGTVSGSDLSAKCKTGAQANTDDDCRVVGFINSVQDYWSNQFQRQGKKYTTSLTVFFSGQTQTGCGTASTDLGPFYCPADKHVYIDLSFWQELRRTFGTNGGVFAEGYVLAHEYGHHVQDLLGTSSKVRGGDSGPTSGSVRLELQADCYAGVWAKDATTTPGPDGKILISDITSQDINDALDTAAKIGDDYIQTQLAGGQRDPSQYTHGTSAQREKWLRAGYSTGNPASCDTFGTNNLG